MITPERVRVASDERQQARGDAGETVGQRLLVGHDRLGRGREGREQRQLPSGGRAGRVHGHASGLFEACDPGSVQPPRIQSLTPARGDLPGIDREVCILVFRLSLVYPWLEIGRRQLREGEREVAHVALGVDDEHRHPVKRSLLDQPYTQSGLAASRHPDDHRVGR